MPFGFTHKPLVALANSAITSFFREIEVIGSENVPKEGPVIFACTHANMAIDPAVLSNTVPHGLSLHYWVKDSLFKNPAVGALLYNAGNIAVDRKTKNNQKLFKGTFDALSLGESIGVFPEGTSHTEPHMIPLKDGTAWSALEYLRYLNGTEENAGPKDGQPAVIVPVGVAYCDKRKYRSRVVVHYGKPITMDAFQEEFMSEVEGANKHAVKRLTRTLEVELLKSSVNAPDWDTAFAAEMAREILWEKDDDLRLEDFVDVSQTLVDLLSTSGNKSIEDLRALLVTYYRLLTASRLSNQALIDIPLPRDLDPRRKLSLPNRFLPLWLLTKDSLSSLIQLPFFLFPLITHIPIYIVGILGARLVEDELETQAQMKIALGLVLSFLTYPVLFFTFWAIFRQVPLGFVIAAGAVFAMGRYHSALVDQNYNAYKRLLAAWRILIGVWIPSKFEMSIQSFTEKAASFAPNPPKVAGLSPSTQPEKYTKPQHLPSRRLVRNVLRTRLEAVRQLANVLYEIEEKDVKLNASYWLADSHGGEVLKCSAEHEKLPEWERPLLRGTRGGREVVEYIRSKGARLGSGKTKSHWAATSGDEGGGSE